MIGTSLGKRMLLVYVYSLYACPAHYKFELFRFIDLVSYSDQYSLQDEPKSGGCRVYSAYRVLPTSPLPW